MRPESGVSVVRTSQLLNGEEQEKKRSKNVRQQKQTWRELNNHVRPITGSVFQW